MTLQSTLPPRVGGRIARDPLDTRPAFPGAELVSVAAGLFDRQPAWTGQAGGRLERVPTWLDVDAYRCGSGAEGREFRVMVAPGTFGVAMSDPARQERNRADGFGNVKGLPPGQVLDDDGRSTGVWREPKPARQVQGWSRRSRARMVRRLAQLDWTPMYDAGRSAVLGTLTYPGDWLTVAPSGADVKRHWRSLQKRYHRRWGAPLVCAWKLEFQRRGAPHLHFLFVPPADPGFRAWLSATWADVVAHPDPEERRRHELAGTGLDFLRGGRCFDPKRAAVYFSKHGGAAGGKEYQHDVPEEWQGEGNGPGRFWGYLGLVPVVAEVVVGVAQYLALRRTLRRWSRAQGLSRTVTVSRVDVRTGVLRHRTVTRRRVYLAHSGMHGGTVLINDGPAFASTLARLSPDRGL